MSALFTDKSTARRLGCALGAIVSALGASFLADWSWDLGLMSRLLPGVAAMKPTSAVGLMLCGASLVLAFRPTGSSWRSAPVKMSGCASALLGLAILGGYFLGWPVALDRVLSSPTTALCFVLAGGGLCLSSKTRIRHRDAVIAALGISMMAIAGLALACRPAQALLGLRAAEAIGVTLPSGLALILLGLGLLLLAQHRGETMWVLRKSVVFGFGGAVLLMLLTAAGAIHFTERMLEASNAVAHSEAILKELQEVSTGMAALESSQRGYIITGNAAMLGGRGAIERGVIQDLADIGNLTRVDADQLRSLTQLRSLVRQRNDFGLQTIQARQEAGFAGAQAMVNAGQGVELTTRIGTVLETMRVHEHMMIEAARGQSTATSAIAFILLPLGVYLSLVIICVGLSLLNAGILAQNRSAAALLNETRQAEAALRARDVAEAANRMKSEFLSRMTHELRTPLNGIIGFTELMVDERAGPVSGPQRQFLDEVLTNGRHLLHLIEDILDLSKIEGNRMIPAIDSFDVASVVEEVCSSLAPLARQKHITLNCACAENLGLVALDRRMVRKILLNLVSNAVKFTPAGGAVSVAIDRELGKLFLRVRDTGIGIKREDLSRLFVEFEQLESGPNRSYPGTGLGLFVSKHLVELLGGSIAVESEPTRGSQFTVTLPYSAPPGRN